MEPTPSLKLTMRNEELSSLVTQLRLQRMLRHDMIVPAASIVMPPDSGKRIIIHNAPPPPVPQTEQENDALSGELATLGIAVEGGGAHDQGFSILSIAEGQFAAKLKIPKKYWDLCADTNMNLLAHNVNQRLNGPGGIGETKEANFLIRTFRPEGTGDGILRALLSDRYRVLDNLDLLFTALQTLGPKGVNAPIDGDNIVCNLTERKMYLQIQCPSISIDGGELLQGYMNPDTREGGTRIYAGLVLSNSETGGGAFQVTPRPYAKVCMNCFTLRRDALRRVHLGAQMEEGAIRWSEKTLAANLKLVENQVRDAVETFLSTDYLLSLSTKFGKLAQQPLEHPKQAVMNYTAHLGLSESEQDDVLKYFYKSGQDTTAIGLVNAVTFHAQTLKSADRQYELEDAALEALEYINRFDRVADSETAELTVKITSFTNQ